jgi:N-acetylmuramoyl-L-alanine amidase
VVVIDPGHGGPDPGAIGIGGLRETDVVLPVAKQIATLLEKQGVEAILTRSTERDLDLAPRVNLAEEVDATVFVSIHANAVGLSRPEVNGLETYYYDSGLDLANTIHRTILEDVNVTDRRVRKANFYVLRETSMPAVLVELGFVTGATDAARLRNPTYRNQMAAAIARGILRYLQRI